MKIGFNLLLWTGHVTSDDFPVIEKLKAEGFDGVEIPIFDPSDPDHFKNVGQFLKDTGLECTAVTVCPDEEHNPISPDDSNRQGAVDHLKRVVECGANAGIQVLCGPYYQVLGQFTGAFPTETELAHAADVHREVAEFGAQHGIKFAIESLNRFESHLLNTIDQAKSYVARVGHPSFGTMYDTFHANIEEKDPLGAIDVGIDVINHVHISENDRGTPGSGHCPIPETIKKLVGHGYDNWLTIEAFGSALPELAAATRVWRDFFPNAEDVYVNGLKCIKDALAAAS